MIPVVIPYLHSAAKGDELRWAFDSWFEFFTEDFRPYIAGPEKPDWLADKYFVKSPYNPKKHKEANLGTVLQWACKVFREFIWTNDDIILLRDTCMQEIKMPYYLQEDFSKLKRSRRQMEVSDRLIREHARFLQTGKKPDPVPGVRNTLWQVLLAGTANRLKELGFTAFNAETHIPYFYDSAKLLRLGCVMDVFSGVYLTHTAYFNVFEDYPLYKIGDQKIGFYGGNGGVSGAGGAGSDVTVTEAQKKNARYLNFNDTGRVEAERFMRDADSEFFCIPSAK